MLQTFTGGIYPPETKNITAGKAFSNLSIPHICYVPMQQHVGKPAQPVVSAGNIVSEGQLIGKASDLLSANIHAPVPGKVCDVGFYPTMHSKKGLCILIEAQGSFTSSGTPHTHDSWESLSREEMIKRIFNAGIVGLGGKAFPTHVKLKAMDNKNVDTLIINGVESEPYITIDGMLMQTFPKEIIDGIKIVQKILNAGIAIIGIEKNRKRAISALWKAINDSSLSGTIKINILKPKYPQGEEKQLIYSIKRHRVPFGCLPADIGIMVFNVGTIFAIYEAVVIKKPFYERYVTVTGEIIRHPGNYKVRLGTRVSEIIEECGGLTEEPGRVILGGPMCGTAIDTMEIPVVKSTSGIVFLKKNQVKLEKHGPCIRCGRCAAVCPARLIPCELVKAIGKEQYDLTTQHLMLECIQCGSCAYTCPSRRPLNYFIKIGRDKLWESNKNLFPEET